MRLRIVLALFALVGASGLMADAAAAHSDGCHSAYSCPSDHHSYAWYDSNGQSWSCARPGSDTYDPSRDTTTITYDGYTYYCRPAGSSTPTLPPPADSDGDGLPDSSDGCPFEFAETSDGCPNPPPRKPRGYKLERTESGPLVAELSYVLRRDRYSRRRIKILREGQVLLDAALPRPPGCDARCSQFVSPTDPANRGAVWLRDLDADGELEVVVDLWTGGANCCTFTVIYGFRALTRRYKAVSEVWGTGYRLRRLGRGDEFQFWGLDYRFKYAFACGACAPLPVRIWQYRAGRLSVATHEFPAVVRRNARRSYRAYLRVRSHGQAQTRGTTRGTLAAWVADQCSLGRCQRGLRTVRRANRRGELRKFHEYDIGPYGQSYVRKLNRMLRRFGYMP
jgi:hypothetical protein